MAMWWRKTSLPAYLLWPFSWVFRAVVAMRRYLYRSGKFKTHTFSCPVVVVGNISVGGNGKTPFVMWLAAQLKAAGYRPGIVSRGYGSKAPQYPMQIQPDSRVKHAGDEPLLLAMRTQCPVVIDPDRVSAAEYLLANNDCNIIISDDGLQHYTLGRDIEIIMVDGQRQFGNGYCLPAGPLREPVSRLSEADFIVKTGEGSEVNLLPEPDKWTTMTLVPTLLTSVRSIQHTLPLNELPNNMPIHAVAGIANPQRFFDTLKAQGLTFTEHVYPDHHAFKLRDINYHDSVVIMTEKDAVKCRPFADERHYFLPVTAELPATFKTTLFEHIRRETNG